MSWERNIVLKSAAEIEIMQQAGHINFLALEAVRERIKPGVTTAELDKVAEELIRDHGAKPAFLNYPGPYPYPATINASVNEEMVHGIPRDRELKEGDIFSVDCGTIFQGFVGDSAFTVALGEVDEGTQTLLRVTEEALYKGIEQMKPGNHVGDVSAAIQQHVESHGFNVPLEYSGHGVGRQMHEGPQVTNYGMPGRGLELRAGMTIAIEPMVLMGGAATRVGPDQWTVSSADGMLTAHFEHSVAVTENEALILTQ